MFLDDGHTEAVILVIVLALSFALAFRSQTWSGTGGKVAGGGALMVKGTMKYVVKMSAALHAFPKAAAKSAASPSRT